MPRLPTAVGMARNDRWGKGRLRGFQQVHPEGAEGDDWIPAFVYPEPSVRAGMTGMGRIASPARGGLAMTRLHCLLMIREQIDRVGLAQSD